MSHTAVIGLGSNINPQTNIAEAKKILGQKYTILAESQFVVTKPIGTTTQPDFINGAVLIKTALAQERVKKDLKNIEISLGRRHETDKFGPRTIDLDIVVWNNQVMDQDFYQRDFLKQSTLELIPNLKY